MREFKENQENFALHIHVERGARAYNLYSIGLRGEVPIGVQWQSVLPEYEGVLAFGCQKKVAKFPLFSVFC